MTASRLHSLGVDRPVTLILAEIAQVLVPSDAIEGRLRRALELLREVVHYEQCAVLVAVPGGTPRVHLVPRPTPSEARAIEPALLRLLGLVSESHPLAGTVRDDPPGTRAESLVSYLAVPLVGSDGSAGLLVVGQGIADAYGEEDLRLLSIVAAQIAAYLTDCRLTRPEAHVAEQRPAHREALGERDERPRVGLLQAHAARLTRRQLDVARLIAAGRSNAQIARELVLTKGTVANHIEHILRRLDVSNRAQVAAWVVERGLLSRAVGAAVIAQTDADRAPAPGKAQPPSKPGRDRQPLRSDDRRRA